MHSLCFVHRPKDWRIIYKLKHVIEFFFSVHFCPRFIIWFLFFKLETSSLSTSQGIAKVSIVVAMLLTFYKGIEINISHNKIDLQIYHHHDYKVLQNNSGMSGHQGVLAKFSWFEDKSKLANLSSVFNVLNLTNYSTSLV